MPTFEVEIDNHQVLMVVKVAVPESDEEAMPFTALVDTGAQKTLISQNVIDGLGAVSSGISHIMPASGEPIQVDLFVLNIAVPVSTPAKSHDGSDVIYEHLSGRQITAARLPYVPHNYDVLLGMDMLSLFHITMFGGRFVMSN